MYVCVCVRPQGINNYWHYMDPINWLNKFYSRFMEIVVVIINGRGLGIDTHHSH